MQCKQMRICMYTRAILCSISLWSVHVIKSSIFIIIFSHLSAYSTNKYYVFIQHNAHTLFCPISQKIPLYFIKKNKNKVLPYQRHIVVLCSCSCAERPVSCSQGPSAGPSEHTIINRRGLDTRGGIFKHLCIPRIDSKESILPAYVAWRAGTITLFLLGSLPPQIV